MRVPSFYRYAGALRLLGVFLVGCIVGGVVLHSLFVAKFEAMYNTVYGLEAKLGQYEADIAKLKQYKNQHTVIKSIQIRVLEESTRSARLDRMTETELVKRVKEDLSILLGRSIYDIDADANLVRKLLESKTYEDVSGKDYAIELKTVLLADNVLQVWMTVRVKAKPPA
ncbi:hypothetical protein [Paenibacillus sp. PAMC21692]|uniref:hypothetical protein n=1 Tax=Paenibacillus sp. PAMC21692 TaxID=2762320 RepID=UPI00164E74E1|nr:hypothetical protein [Paenibacillus sp. PAMC21692]QNK59929.1 hypothetical protein H7F31_14305 [Paenibacillus sp. PAMC21692]